MRDIENLIFTEDSSNLIQQFVQVIS